MTESPFLGISIAIYILFTLVIGFWASRRIKSSLDFTLAGRQLSTVLVGVTIFATWFGPELLMGMPALFATEGTKGIIADQFSTLLCLIIIARFFTRKMHDMKVITINDFFRDRFNPKMELVTSLVNILVYVAWIGSQLLALALIFNSLFDISLFWGVILGSSVVVIYTYIGGMWAVSYTDFIQSIVIIGGLLALLVVMLAQTNILDIAIASKPASFWSIIPEPTVQSWSVQISDWAIFAVGALASQEIYQRSNAARNSSSAVNGVYMSGILIFMVGIIPLLLGLMGGELHPELLEINEGQNLIPEIVARYAHPGIQILVFGALISAILSTSSGAMLAPATIIGENVIKPLYTGISDAKLLLTTRLSVILVAIIAGGIALLSKNIHDLVILATSISMVSLVAPFTLGLFWSRTSITGAWLGVILGTVSFLTTAITQTTIEPFLIATAISFISVWLGSLAFPDQSNTHFAMTLKKRHLEP